MIGLPQLNLASEAFLLPYGEGATIRRYIYQLDPELTFPISALGFDPGQVHMGLAYIYISSAILYEIEMPGYTDSIERIMAITGCLQYIFAGLPKAHVACIEGASFLAAYGQVPLSEARTTAAIAILTSGVPAVAINPPRQIRKGIFGKAEFRSQEMWPDIPENASSALGCAFYAYKIAREEYIAKNGPPK